MTTEPLSEKITREQHEKIQRDLSGRPIMKLPAASTPMLFERWMEEICKDFPTFAFAVEACVSAMLTLLLKDIGHCTTILIVDASSSGKTMVLNIVAGLAELVVTRDHLTGASFVTNTSNVKRENLSKLDLLPQIKGRVLICRDMAPIFSAREEDLGRTMGVLTRVLDGEGYETHTGTHGARGYKGNYSFVLLAATTPIDRRVWRMMSRLGPRILCLKLHSVEKTEDELADQLKDTPYREKMQRCQNKTSELLKTLWAKYPEGAEWDRSKDPDVCRKMIARCAKFACRFRGQVSDTDRGNGHRTTTRVHLVSMERPDRVTQTLYDIARGHALLLGRTNITMDDMPLIVRLMVDSVPEERQRLMTEIIRCRGEIDTKSIERFLKCSNPMALRAMATLCTLGICEEVERIDSTESKQIRLCKEFEWFFSDEFHDLLCRSLAFPEASDDCSKQG